MPAPLRALAAAALVVAVTVSCGAATGSEPTGDPTPTGGPAATTVPRSSGRPGGQPPGVRHDIPRVNDNLTAQDDWVRAVRNRCNEVGEGDRCLRFRYVVHEVDGQGRSRDIADPGPGYADGESPRYDPCIVTDVNPPGGDDVTIPSGTTITVSIDCHRSEDDGADGSPTPTPEPGG